MKFLDKDKIIKAFHFRHACKAFDGSKKLSEQDFRTILESARLSPSSFGFEPWNLLILRDKAVREKIFAPTWGGQDALKNASEFVIILARKNADLHPQSTYITHMMNDIHGLNAEAQSLRRGFFDTFQKDHFCFYNNDPKIFDWACKQCYIALGNMLSVAGLLGVDSLPIEGFNRAQAEEILADSGLLDSKHFGVAVMCAFGFRLNKPKHAKTRQSLESITTFV